MQDFQFGIVGCYKGSEMAGGMALAWKQKSGSLPMIQIPVKVPIFGPVIAISDTKYRSKQENQLHTTTSVLMEFIEKRYNGFISIFPPSVIDIRSFIWKGYDSDVHYTSIVDLNEYQDIQSHFSAQEINDITNAEKLNYRLHEEASHDTIGNAWEQAKRTFGSEGIRLKDHSKESFIEYIKALVSVDSAAVFTMTHENNPMESRILILDKNKSTGFNWFHGINGEDLSQGLSKLFKLKIINRLREEGIRYYDLGGFGPETSEKAVSSHKYPLSPMYSVFKYKNSNKLLKSFMGLFSR
jgi:hypothetical protein